MRTIAPVVALLSACGSSPPSPPDGIHVLGEVDGATHVVAVAGERRAIVEVTGGAFDVALRAGEPTALVFADGTRLAGVWHDGSLDTLTLWHDGDVDLGRVTLDGDRATSELAGDALLAAIGMDATTAATIGALDDLALRYANPDLDGDGTLDAEGVRLELRAELLTTASIAELAGPHAIGYQHVGTAVTVRVPDTMAFDAARATVTFEQPFVGVANGAELPVVPAGEPIHDVLRSKERGFGVYAAAGHDVPRGGYRFDTGGATLSFVDVLPPANAAMAAMMDQVMPDVTLVVGDTGAVAALEVAWMRNTPGGWVGLSDAELAIVRPRSHLDIVTSAGFHAGFDLPGDAVTASLPWTSVDDIDMSYESFTKLAPRDLAWIGVQTEGQLGLRTYANITTREAP